MPSKLFFIMVNSHKFQNLNSPSIVKLCRIRGGPDPGGANSKKLAFWDIKFQIFGAEEPKMFWKIEVFKEKSAIFWSFMGKFVQILINIVILD